ncbi:hypothetical protein DFH06DRAFT_1142291 [Mycena polygramma]|nr:hypothetical protein DFH06DRAFT_1142291 [Mycena polygramma]
MYVVDSPGMIPIPGVVGYLDPMGNNPETGYWRKKEVKKVSSRRIMTLPPFFKVDVPSDSVVWFGVRTMFYFDNVGAPTALAPEFWLDSSSPLKSVPNQWDKSQSLLVLRYNSTESIRSARPITRIFAGTNGPLYTRAHPEARGRWCHWWFWEVGNNWEDVSLFTIQTLPHFRPYEGGMMYNSRSQGGGGGLGSQSALRTDIWLFSVASFRCGTPGISAAKLGLFSMPLSSSHLNRAKLNLSRIKIEPGVVGVMRLDCRLLRKECEWGIQWPGRLSSSSISILIEVPSSWHHVRCTIVAGHSSSDMGFVLFRHETDSSCVWVDNKQVVHKSPHPYIFQGGHFIFVGEDPG